MDGFVIRIMVADGHPAMVIGIEHALSAVSTMTIVGKVGNSTDLIAALDEMECDVLISDDAMAGGKYGDSAALLPFIRGRYPALKLLVLTMRDNPIVLRTLRGQKISCIVSKSDAAIHLVPAIYAAYTGGIYYSPSISKINASIAWRREGATSTTVLTERESEVIRSYASGLTVTAIAAKLHKSRKTISTQKARAMAKLDLHDDIDLLRYAMENGFVDYPTNLSSGING